MRALRALRPIRIVHHVPSMRTVVLSIFQALPACATIFALLLFFLLLFSILGIQFFGGIHEVYFIYVLLRPRFILSLIAGGFVGSAIFTWGNAGLTGFPQPASIMEIADKTPSDSVVAIVFGVLISALVSFVISWALVRTRCNSMMKRICNLCNCPCNVLDHYV